MTRNSVLVGTQIELLVAISRREVANHKWAAAGDETIRWHTKFGRTVVSAGRGGGSGLNVTPRVNALMARGLVEIGDPVDPGQYRPYRLTDVGRAALDQADVPACASCAGWCRRQTDNYSRTVPCEAKP